MAIDQNMSCGEACNDEKSFKERDEWLIDAANRLKIVVFCGNVAAV